MKILILADTHDNIVRLRHVMGFAKEIGAETIIHCGDWGRALIVDNFTRENLQTTGGMKIQVYGVLGNADIDPDLPKRLKEENIIFEKDFLEIKIDGKKIGVAHYPISSFMVGGKMLNEAFESGLYDILFFGHTHKKSETTLRHMKLVNPGALERVYSPSFVVYDTQTNKVEFIDTQY